MKISILTLFPEIFTGFKETSIIKKAILKELVELEIVDMRAFTEDKHRRVDDYPYGGGAGLVLMCQPVVDAIRSVKTEESTVVLLSPQGPTFNQTMAYEYAEFKHLILVCGHYEGFDERIRDYVDMELSIGDYVLTGGETAAMVVSDAVIRLVDGVITQESHEDDSFSDGLLEYPQYTRPREFEGKKVPDVLLSGHHGNIETFRLKESLRKTMKIRPDLLEGRSLNDREQALIEEIKKEEQS